MKFKRVPAFIEFAYIKNMRFARSLANFELYAPWLIFGERGVIRKLRQHGCQIFFRYFHMAFNSEF